MEFGKDDKHSHILLEGLECKVSVNGGLLMNSVESRKLKGDPILLKPKQVGEDETAQHVINTSKRPCTPKDGALGDFEIDGGCNRVPYGSEKKVLNRNPNNSNIETSASNFRQCCVCSKIFPSIKSLHGHMRSHPERNWRGTRPPLSSIRDWDEENYSNALQSEHNGRLFDNADDDDDVSVDSDVSVDLFNDLINTWSSTAKRGRKPIALNSRSCWTYDELETASSLVLLSRGYNDDFTTTPRSKGKKKQRVEQDLSHGPLLDSRNPNTYAGDDAIYKADRAYKRKLDQILKETGKLSCDGKEKDCSPSIMKSLSSEKRKLSNVKGERADDTSSEKPFKCSICNKSFSTYHALGGHMSSHNKYRKEESRINFQPVTNYTEQQSEDLKEEEADGDVRSPSNHDSNKTFTTGQALGGHQRCHWNGSTLGQHEAASSENGAANYQRRPRLLDFDLNTNLYIG